MIDILVGYDKREAIAYHVFCNSVMERTSIPVRFTPLTFKTAHTDGSNSFIYSRFLAPWLFEYQGWVLFADGDMVCKSDIFDLWMLRDSKYAVQVVKHDYKTKYKSKYLGNKNEDYPRKNWSSLILWNCAHPKNKVLTPQYIQNATGKQLHRFEWLDDSDIGEIPVEWNWLAMEYEDNPAAKLVHYTIGTPCFKDYVNCEMAEHWRNEFHNTLEGIGR